MGDRVTTEKPKGNKWSVLGCLVAICAGVWRVVKELSKDKKS